MLEILALRTRSLLCSKTARKLNKTMLDKLIEGQYEEKY